MRFTKLLKAKILTIAFDNILDSFVFHSDRVDRIDYTERQALIEILVAQARSLQNQMLLAECGNYSAVLSKKGGVAIVYHGADFFLALPRSR